MGNEPDRIFEMMLEGAGMGTGPGRWSTLGRNLGRLLRPFLGIWLGLVLATRVDAATAGVVPEGLYKKASGEGVVRGVKLRVEATAEAQLGSAEQPSPAPGPGPVPPGSERQAPLPSPPSTEKATEVPIGRPEGYEEEKRKALEIPFHGRPPGAIQEDPTVGRGGAEPNSCSHK